MRKKVSIGTLLLISLLVSLITYSVPKYFAKQMQKEATPATPLCKTEMDQIRLNNYKYAKPLVLANINDENPSLLSLRSSIEQYITKTKAEGMVDDLSVYFRRLNDGSWFCLNPDEAYNPASMSKVIFLISYLKDAEINPGILNKKIYFERHFSEVYNQNIKDFELKQKTYYTVRELLNIMITYSDNDATVLLIQNLNEKTYEKVFADFHIPLPPRVGEYAITVSDFSKFFRALYNATYIRPDLSELGLEILTHSTYSKGLRRGVDSSVEIAHKFGERIIDANVQLHEFGIVFTDGEPYLIGVMTKGKSLQDLSEVIAGISKIAFTDYHRANG
jgi:beta-lactamase class A